MNPILRVALLCLLAACAPTSDLVPASVTVSPSQLETNVQTTVSLTATVKNAAGEKLEGAVTWRSSDATVATVDGAGLVTTKKIGAVKIYAKAGSVEGSSSIGVLPIPQDANVSSVTVTPKTVTLGVDATQPLVATAKNAAGETLTAQVTWTSGDSSIATVSAAGVVTGKAAGTVAVTASASGKTDAASITVLTPTKASARQTKQSLMSGQTRVRFWQYLPSDYTSSTATYPLLIFLHGAGETSQNDAPSADATEYERVLVHGPPKLVRADNEMCFTSAGVRSCMIVLSPQAPKADGWWNNARIRSLLDYAKANLRVDAKRVYITGLSMGGGGTWNFSSDKSGTQLYASELAAVVPIAGASGYSSATCNIAASGLPVWAFHGSADGTVLPQSSRDFVSVINGTKVGSVQCAANPVKALLTEYPAVGHDSWTQTYDPTKRFDPVTAQPAAGGVNIYEWLLGYHR